MTKRDVYRLTRDTGFLWKSAAGLAAVLLAFGTAISFLNSDRMNALQEVIATPRYVDGLEFESGDNLSGSEVATALIESALREILFSNKAFHEKLEDTAFLLRFFQPEEHIELAFRDGLSQEQTDIANALIAACVAPGEKQALETLKQMAALDPPPIDANYALAIALENHDIEIDSLDALAREVEQHDSPHARERMVHTYLEMNEYDVLEALALDPKNRLYFTPHVLQRMALDRGDWPMILKTHFIAAYEGVDPAMVMLALLSGLIWATIVIRFNGSFRRVWAFIIPALILGALSAHATLMVIYLQDQFGILSFGANTMQQLLYCVGIGLREEGLKLLLFIPLVPFLLRRDDLDIITIAGLVGLGFALEENINYFERSAGLSAVARFATANFLHIALTAMCGLTLVRAIVHRGEEWQRFGITFITAVGIHAAYDAFLMVPVLVEYSWLAFTTFILMGYQYFGWLRHLREEWRDPISATAVFTYGIILVTSLTFGLYAWNSGPMPAFQAVMGEVIAIAIMLILFYREIPETVE